MSFFENFERYPKHQLYLCNTYIVSAESAPYGVCLSKKILYKPLPDSNRFIDPVTKEQYNLFDGSNPVGSYYYKIIASLLDLNKFNESLSISISLYTIKKYNKILIKGNKNNNLGK